MSSRIAKPGQTDQRKIYLNWANHFLRKTEDGTPISDLKEVADGHALPRVLKAVVQEAVPGIHATVNTDQDRRENIEKCIQFLEKVGVKCSSFTTKDLYEGKDRAILALFYSLSQFKRNPGSGSASSSSSPAPSKSAPQPSRIARPTSPSLKTVHGVNINGPSVSAPPQASSPQATSPQSPQASSKKDFNLSVASMSPPATSPVSPNPSSHKMGLGGGPRRTAGSSIMTSTTFDRPYMHRKPQKTGNGEETKSSPTAGDTEGSKALGNGQLSMSDSHVPPTAEVKSDPENDDNSSKQKTTKLSKHSSFSFGHSSLPQTRLLKPGASKGTAVAEKAESATPPTQSKLKGPAGGSKLQAPAQKTSKDGATPSGGTAGEALQEQEAPAHTGSGGGSRLKFPGSGRNTPSSNMRSGIQRPSSRLSKMGSNSTSNLVGEEEEEGVASKLRLQRKASDGAVKRHLVAPSSSSKTSMPSHVTGHVIQSGTSSLPRNLPKGSLSPRQPGKGLSASLEHDTKTLDNTKIDEVPSSGKPEGKPDGKAEEKQKAGSPSKDTGGEKSSSSKAEGAGFGLRKPSGGLKKPGSGPLSGVRTPNLPSSGPQSSTTASSQGEPERGHTPQKEEGVTVGSPSLGKKLMQPKLSTGGLKPPGTLESRLKRAASPSARHKLHRITPAGTSHAPTGADHTPVDANHISADANHSPASINHVPPSAGQEPPSEAKSDHIPLNSINSALTSSSSSLDSELHGGTPTSQGGVPGKEAELQKAQDRKEKIAEVVNDIPQKSEIEAPPTEVKTAPIEAKEDIGKEGHLRFGRRISPEGMSHEEISSPKGDGPEKLHPQSPPIKTEDPLLSSGDADSSSTEKEVAAVTGTVGGDAHLSRFKNSDSVEKSPSRSQRARSLSPKSPHRLLPKGMARVRDFENGGAGLKRTISSESTSSEGGTPSLSRKPLKSSLRQKRGGSSGSKSRHSSSSSLEGVISPSGPRPKVTISPRSSQVVYDPEATGLHPVPPNHAHKFLSVGGTSERPSSFGSLDSSTTSDSLSPSNSTSALYTRPQGGGGGVARHASMRTTMSEQLEYRSEHPQFLSPVPGEVMGSTPELIESFENQLTNMKAELSDKDRMLSMYANSMSDLNTKMHLLKKSLEEKDNAIRHLTEKQSWLDLESHSPLLSASRAPSVAADHEALSDGYLSDSAMDDSKDKGKKKKQWKNPFRKKKEGGGDHLSPNMDTESIISGRSAKSLKRSFGKKRAPDLMSISEDPPRFMKDIDTKSTYTMDLRSEYGGGGLGPLWEDDQVKVYDDPEPGARAEVVLYIDTNEPRPAPANDSGYYGDILGRNKWSRDSRDSMASSVSSDSGNHSDEACEQFVLGTLSVAPEVSWVSMDTKIGEIFHHHMVQIDPENALGLSEDSVYCYFVGEERRQVGNALLPPVTPYEALANKLTIKLHMKGAGQQCCDSLAYKTLMGTDSLQSYMAILHETQWLVVMGTKGTCKSSLVSGLAQHLSICLEAEEGEGMEDILMGVVGGEIIRFNLDKEGVANPLKYFKTDLVKRVQLQLHPPIVVLEDVYECKDLEQLLVAAGSLSRRPYIIAALSSGTTKGIPLHQLLFHHQIRLITCNPQTEPVAGVLARSLRKQVYQLKATAQSLDPVAERLVNWVPYLLRHLNAFINKFHSNVVNFGPRVFMSCPLHSTAAELESWFHSLWNHFIIPYLMGTIMAGIETYTADPSLEWVDVREWVIEMYPWPSAINVSKLRTLSPEDVGWNHAVRPHQSRFIMVNDKLADDTRSLLHDTQSIIR